MCGSQRIRADFSQRRLTTATEAIPDYEFRTENLCATQTISGIVQPIMPPCETQKDENGCFHSQIDPPRTNDLVAHFRGSSGAFPQIGAAQPAQRMFGH